jgi:hypothetical protein
MSRESTALLIIDFQEDFLRRPGLQPEADELVERLSVLLEGFRQLGLPVAHAHTCVLEDGGNAMPHWREKDMADCRAGSPGVLPPPPRSLRQKESRCFSNVSSAHSRLLNYWLGYRNARRKRLSLQDFTHTLASVRLHLMLMPVA